MSIHDYAWDKGVAVAYGGPGEGITTFALQAVTDFVLASKNVMIVTNELKPKDLHHRMIGSWAHATSTVRLGDCVVLTEMPTADHIKQYYPELEYIVFVGPLWVTSDSDRYKEITKLSHDLSMPILVTYQTARDSGHLCDVPRDLTRSAEALFAIPARPYTVTKHRSKGLS